MYVDKRLAGIQAVQTLSRLNRAHPGKDTTYVLDFVNDAEEVLAAFKTYYDDGRTGRRHRSEPGLRPARQARRRRPLRRLRGRSRRRGGAEPEAPSRATWSRRSSRSRTACMKRYKAAQEALKAAHGAKDDARPPRPRRTS